MGGPVGEGNPLDLMQDYPSPKLVFHTEMSPKTPLSLPECPGEELQLKELFFREELN